jgi:hypothetical protein
MTTIPRFVYWFFGFCLVFAIGLTLVSQTGRAQAGATYPIVDTGQAVCYDSSSSINCPTEGQAFYGQDAQIDGNQPGYTLSADGLTVHDSVTGLTWTQSPDLDDDGDIDADDKLSFAEALTYADTTLNPQNYGGYNDWRLPTIKELYSLIDFGGLDVSGYNGDTSGLMPFIDTDYFDFGYGDTSAGERLIDAQFWSSTEYLGTTMGGNATTFGVNFADGRIKGYPQVNKDEYVYFVRGDTDYGMNDFADNGDGTVTDAATQLVWSKDDSGTGMDWEAALAWVQQKNDENYLGYSDWRLPNAKELQSIVDYSRSPQQTGTAAIDPIFDITSITVEDGGTDWPCFWSSTTHGNMSTNHEDAWGVYVCFGEALGYWQGTWQDVHGAGAQRSDPKSGDPSDYPTGHGPQGDAVRIENFVRLVRDADTEVTLPGEHRVFLPLTQTGAFTTTAALMGNQPVHPKGQPGPELQLPSGDHPPGVMPEQPSQSRPDRQPPPQAIAGCDGQSKGASCRFVSSHGLVTGTCDPIHEHLVCIPEGGAQAGSLSLRQ